jgi:anti-sigma B factor antagonist
MSMKINQTDTFTQVTFSGRLDDATAAEIKKDAVQVIEKENNHVIIDCTGLEYISSSGLRVLLMLQKRAIAKKIKLSVCSLESGISEIFNISGFSGIFRIYPDLETAVNNS